MTRTYRHAPGATKPARRLQLLVWFTFIVLAVAAYAFSSIPSAATTGGQSGVLLHAAGTGSDATGTGASSAVDQALIQARYNCSSGPDSAQECESMTDLLPAFRWQGSMAMPTKSGFSLSSLFYGALTAIADMMFTIAGWMWWLLLMLVKVAVSTDLLHAAGAGIDRAFSGIVGGFTTSGIPFIIGAVIIAGAMFGLLRGGRGRPIMSIVGAVVVIGAMFGLSAAAAGSKDATTAAGGDQTETAVDPAAGLNTGSPAWLAVRGSDALNALAGEISTGFGLTDYIGKSATEDLKDPVGPTCTVYLNRLTNTYTALMDAKAQATGDASLKLTSSALTSLSSIWQRSMYLTWTQGALGNNGAGARVACHQLEWNANIPAAEQFALVGGPLEDGAVVPPQGAPGYQGIGIGPFVQTGNGDTDYGSAFAWAACLGPDKVADGWQVTMILSKEQTDAPALETVGTDNCKAWYTWLSSENDDWDGPTTEISASSFISWLVGSGAKKQYDGWGINSCEDCADKPVLQWDATYKMRLGMEWDGKAETATDPWSHRNAIDETVSTIESAWGNNGGSRLAAGMFSSISAVLYLWAFGLAAVGTLLAQVGLLFLLVLLPVTLLFLAFSRRDGGRSRTGVKMFTMTAAFLGGKLVFLVLLAAMLQLMRILWVVVESLTGTSSDGWYMLWMLVVPVAAIFVLRMLLKALGLGNIMSVGGAAGFATKAVMSASDGGRGALRGAARGTQGGSMLSRGMSRLSSGLRSLPGRTMRHLGGKAAGALAQNGKLSPQLARAVASGRMGLMQAGAMQKGLLSPQLSGAVASGRMSLAEGIFRSRSINALENRGASDTTSVTGGYAAALERVRGGLDPAGATLSPVFADPQLRAGANGAALAASQQQALAASAEIGKGLSAAEYEAASMLLPAGNLEALRAGVQGVALGMGRALSAAEVDLERARFAEVNGVPAQSILLGDSGAPALLAPTPRGARGALQFDLTGTEQDMLSQACNMANYLRLDVPTGATKAQVHLQTALTMQALGGLSDSGQVSYDFIREHTGMDPATAAGKARIVETMRDQTGRSELDRLSIQLPYEQRQAIYKLVYDNYPGAAMNAMSPVIHRTVEVQTLAKDAQGQAERALFAAKDNLSRLSKINPSSPDFTAEVSTAIRALSRAPEILVDLGAVSLEAQTTRQLITAGSVNLDTAEEMAAAGERAAKAFRDELGRLEASVKTASADGQGALLQQIAKVVEKKLNDATGEMELAVKGMMRDATNDAESTARKLNAQLGTPPRASDLAAGAKALPAV